MTYLEGIHAGNLDLLINLGVERSLVLHVLDEIGALPLVRGDHSDLVSQDAALDESIVEKTSKTSSFRIISSLKSHLVTSFSTLAASVLLR